jgi:hypothetical protein
MNDPKKKVWWIVLPALSMWLGWGIRGQVGHWTGAMIPGALLGLALSILLKGKRFSTDSPDGRLLDGNES